MFAAAMIVILGFAAMAVDIGFLLAERRGVQNAADAAAMAAARHIARGNDAASAEVVGYDYAELNGFSDGGDTSISLSVDSDEVAASVEHEVTSFFLRAFYTGSWSVSASATAMIVPDPGPFAMIALGDDPSCNPANSGIRFSGLGPGAGAEILGGGIGSNSCIRVDGSPPSIFVDGNVEAQESIIDSQSSIQQPEGMFASGNMNQISDPFEGIDPPPCTGAGNVFPMGDRAVLTPGSFNSVVQAREIYLTPGVYCFQRRVHVQGGGIIQSVDVEIDLSSPGDLEDVFDEIDSEPTQANGGVLVYFTGNNGYLQLSGGSRVMLRSAGFLGAPLTGCGQPCDEDFVIWMSEPGCQDFQTNGNVENELVGLIYAPCSEVGLGGTSGSVVLTGMVVADSIEIFGNATFNLVAPPEPPGDATRVYLVE